MLIKPKMVKGLNAQIGREYSAALQYVAMGAWCQNEGYDGFAKFFQAQAAEENEHGHKVVHYLGEVDGKATIPALPEPTNEWASMEKMLEQFVASEEEVTRAVYDLVVLAQQEGDFSAVQFLQWFVEEQREEVSSARSLLDRARKMGEGRLLLLDAHLMRTSG